MSVDVMSAVFKRYPNGGGEMILALALADHAHDDGTKVFPFVKSLAEKTRQSVRAVQYQLRRMEEAGWLILVNAGNGGRGQPSEYRINPDWLKGADFAQLKRVQNEAEKGATDDIKGANGDIKGCKAFAPAYNHQEPSLTVIEPSGAAKRSSAAKLEIPDWLPTESWASWERFRKAKSAKAWTADAKLLCLRSLAKLRAAGHDPTLVIEQSIERGWTGLFELKTSNYGAAKHGNFGSQNYRAGIGADGSF